MEGDGDARAAAELEDTLKGLDGGPEESFDDTLAALEAVASGKDPGLEEEPGDDDGQPDIDPEVDEEEEPEVEEEPEEEEPEAAEEVEPEAEPKGLSKKGKADWGALKEAKERYKTQAKEIEEAKATLEAELAELRPKLAEAEEWAKQKELYEDAQKELAIARVEGTRDYKETIKKPLDSIEEQIVAIAKTNEISVEKLFSAIEEPDPVKRRQALNEVTEDMNRVDQDDVFQMSRDAQTLLAKKAEVQEKAREGLKEARERESAEKAASERKFRDEIEKSVPHVVGELSKRFPIRKIDGEEAAPDQDSFFSKMTDALKKHDFDGDPVDRKVYQAASSVLLKRATAQLTEAYDKIAKLEARVEKKNRTKPKLGDDAPPPKADDEGDIDDHVADFLNLQRSQDITQRLSGV